MIFYIFYLLIVFIVGLTSFMVTNNLIFCIIATFVFLIYFILFEFLIKKKAIIKKRKKDDLSIFIHDFLSVYFTEPNIDKALQFASNRVSFELQEELKMLEEYKSKDKLLNLSNYFSNNIYELFLGIIKDKGNNKELIKYVKRENDFTLKEMEEFDKGIKKTILEYLILWIASSLILVAMRFAIHNYFNKVSNSIYYLMGVSIFYIVFILSIHLLVKGCVRKYEQN